MTYAGGGFMSAKKGDGVWLFGLEGNDGAAAAASIRRSVVSGAHAAAFPRGRRCGNGEKIYRSACMYCHGDHGQGGEGGGKAIARRWAPSVWRLCVSAGRDKMPAFAQA